MKSVSDEAFEFLPKSTIPRVVIGWGRILNDHSGSFKQEIISVLHDEDNPEKLVVKRRDDNRLCNKVDLGSLKLFSPGTVFQNQKITKQVHEYLKKQTFTIENPRSLEESTLNFGLAHFTIYTNYILRAEKSLDEIPVVKAQGFKDFKELIIPCSAIADYYYYGMSKMIKYILEGKVDREIASNNKLYDPEELGQEKLSSGKTIARIHLEKDMYTDDAVKIARLAHDEFFWDSCLQMNSQLIGRKKSRQLKTKFPIQGPTTLQFYGVEAIMQGENNFIVQSISMCSSKMPFDGLYVSRDNPGGHNKRSFNSEKEDAIKDEKTEEEKKNNGTKPTIRIGIENKNPDPKVGVGKAGYNSQDKDMSFERDQVDNFDNANIFLEETITEDGEESGLLEFLYRFDENVDFTTMIEKSGDKATTRINLSSKSPIVTLDPPQVTCFDMIEKAIDQLPTHLITNTICPFPKGNDKYSTFDPNKYANEENEKNLSNRKWCHINIQKKRFKIYRRIFIKEIFVSEKYFYVMDIEPKYLKPGKNNTSSHVPKFAAILIQTSKTTQTTKITDKEFVLLLEEIVKHRGNWNLLGNENDRQLIRIPHIGHEYIANKIKEFIINPVKKVISISPKH